MECKKVLIHCITFVVVENWFVTTDELVFSKMQSLNYQQNSTLPLLSQSFANNKENMDA
jgi:hypothetical protein